MSHKDRVYFETKVMTKIDIEKEYHESYLLVVGGAIRIHRPDIALKLDVSKIKFTNEIKYLSLQTDDTKVLLQTDEFLDRIFIWYQLKQAIYDCKVASGISVADEDPVLYKNILSDCGKYIKHWTEENEFEDFRFKPPTFAQFYSAVWRIVYAYSDLNFRNEYAIKLNQIGFSTTLINFFVYLTNGKWDERIARYVNTTRAYVLPLLGTVSLIPADAKTVLDSGALKLIIPEMERIPADHNNQIHRSELHFFINILKNCSKIHGGRQQIRDHLSVPWYKSYLKSEDKLIRLEFFMLYQYFMDKEDMVICETDDAFLEYVLDLIESSLHDDKFMVTVTLTSEFKLRFSLHELLMCLVGLIPNESNRNKLLNKDLFILFKIILQRGDAISKFRMFLIIIRIARSNYAEVRDLMQNHFRIEKETGIAEFVWSSYVEIVVDYKKHLARLLTQKIYDGNVKHVRDLLKKRSGINDALLTKYLKISAIKDYPEMSSFLLSFRSRLKFESYPLVSKNIDFREKVKHLDYQNAVDYSKMWSFWISVLLVAECLAGFLTRKLHDGNVDQVRDLLNKLPSDSLLMKFLKMSPIKGHPAMSPLKLSSDPAICKNVDFREKIKHISCQNAVDYDVLSSNVSPFWISVFLGRYDIVRTYTLENIDDREIEICFDDACTYPQLEDIFMREINRRMQNTDGLELNLKNVVPVYDCKTGKRTLLAYSEEVSAPHSTIVCGVPVQFRNPLLSDLEAVKVVQSKLNQQSELEEEELSVIKEIIEFNGEHLFARHSNLNIISGSPIKSIDGQLSRNTCIVLYCYSKGYIPLKEEHFPKELHHGEKHLPVDVREGLFQLGGGTSPLEYNTPLRMGCSVGNRDEPCGGTLGPFIDIGENKIGFLTCSHVIYPHLPLTKSQEKQPVIPVRKTAVVQPANDTFASYKPKQERECGKVLRYAFDTKSSTGVDAAVVQITDQRAPEKGYFVINKPMERVLKGMGFDTSKHPTFDTGSVVHQVPRKKRRQFAIKFGSITGLTQGCFILDGTQVALRDSTMTVQSSSGETLSSFVMKGQYEIQQIGSDAFFRPGDSGSGVFLVDDEDQLHCIGIAIGVSNYNTAIVTPICPVLDLLGVKLKEFCDEDMDKDT